MKILHTSDLHLDSPLTARLTKDKIRSRKAELISTFRATVEIAAKEGADGYIIAGDLFDSESVSREALESFIYTVKGARDITFYYLAGNHEKNALRKYSDTLPENLKFFEDDWTYFKHGDAVIAGRCKTEKNMFDTLSLSTDTKNVVVLHGELRDRSDEGGIIGKNEIGALPIDYLALGHYHRYEEIEISPRVKAVYCGTPEGRGFDEDGEKGVVLLTLDPFSLSHEFIRSAKRTLHIKEVDIGSAASTAEAEDLMRRALSKIPRSDLVRVVFIGERDIFTKINFDYIKAVFKNEYYCFEAIDRTRARISAEDFKNDRSLKGEFIRGIIADTSLSERERELIIETGLSALAGEEID